jgi:hypothetical protein
MRVRKNKIQAEWQSCRYFSPVRRRLIARLLQGTLEHDRVPERGVGWGAAT